MAKVFFGETLYTYRGRHSYIRVPNWLPFLTQQTTFEITTQGFVFSSFANGRNPLEWDRIQEINTSNTNYLFNKYNIKGNLTVSIPISVVVMGDNGNQLIQEFPDVPAPFYNKLVAARTVAKMFSGDKDKYYWRADALRVWANKFINEERDVSRSEYIIEICKRKINQIFSKDPQNKRLAMQLYENGKISAEDTFKKPDNEIRADILEAIRNSQNQTQGQTGQPSTGGVNPNPSGSTGRGNTSHSSTSPSRRRNRNRNYQGFDKYRDEDR